MKERYVKPDLRVEYFTLSQSVATGGCTPSSWGPDLGRPTQAERGSCGWNFGLGDLGLIAWVANSACTDIYDQNAEINGVCYNNPNGGFSIFGS